MIERRAAAVGDGLDALLAYPRRTIKRVRWEPGDRLDPPLGALPDPALS